MADRPGQHQEQPGPAEFRDPLIQSELKRASVWFGLALLIGGVVLLAQPLLLIVGALVFAVLIDGGARLLGRVLPIGRGWRMAIVLLAAIAFNLWLLYFAGTSFAAQAEALRAVVEAQGTRLWSWAYDRGLVAGSPETIQRQLVGAVGPLTNAVGSAVGVVASAILMVALGTFLASEPRLYDRGIAWMLPLRHRQAFYEVVERVGFNLRRLLFGRLVGMVFEGLFTYTMLAIVGPAFGMQPFPLAGLLALITGLLAFIPNIGAVVSGLLMVAVGFSVGNSEGLYAIFVYFFVQNIDGYLVVPYIARKTVDLAPATVLAAQLLLGALFGFLGLLLADPILASIKVMLEEITRFREKGGAVEAESAKPPPT